MRAMGARTRTLVGGAILGIVACGAIALAGAGVGTGMGTGTGIGSVAQTQTKRAKPQRGWDDGDDGGFQLNVRTREDGKSGQPVTSCNQIEVTSRRGEVARGEEVQTVPRSAQTLSVMGAKNGPVSVTGTDRSDYQITLCKFAVADTTAEADSRVAELSLSIDNNRVGVNGPSSSSSQNYVSYVIVETPRDARLDVGATNGPLSLNTVNGQITAHALNGPLGVRGCSGDLNIESKNGPVTVTESSGRMKVNAQNGPLALNLSGQDWQGAGLDASAHNGPLSLRLPENYHSGVRVEISPHSPFVCHASACQSATRNWDNDSRTLQFGPPDATLVRVSATNGPVSIGTSNRD
jgi:hypothetical protein